MEQQKYGGRGRWQRILALFLAVIMVIGSIGLDTDLVLAAKKTSVKTVTLKVDSKSVNNKTISLTVGKTKQIKVTVSPSAAKKSIKYSSSKSAYATVSSKGVVKAKKAGTTVITVTVTGKDKKKKTAKFTVKVAEIAVSSITLKPVSKSITVGSTTKITATLSPAGAKSTLQWKSGNTSVLKITSNGSGYVKVKGLKPGKAKVTCISANKKSRSITITVKSNGGSSSSQKPGGSSQSGGGSSQGGTEVNKVVTGINLTAPENFVAVGFSTLITADLLPSGVSSSLSWESSDPSVFTVSTTDVPVRSARVTAVKEGKATITCKATNGVKKSIELSAMEVAATGIDILEPETTVLTIGETLNLAAEVTPANATYRGITWESKNPTIASVDANGKVTALSTVEEESANDTAEVEIWATHEDKDGTVWKDSVTITVKRNKGQNAVFINAELENPLSHNSTLMNTVLVGETAKIRVWATNKNGLPYTGTLSASLSPFSGYDYYELFEKSIRFGDDGIATVQVKLKDDVLQKFKDKQVAHSQEDYAYASYQLTLQAEGAVSKELPISFAQLIPETMNSNAALAVENQHNNSMNLIKSSSSSLFSTYHGLNANDYVEEYVVDQQVSINGDENMVVLDATPVLLCPSSIGSLTRGLWSWAPDEGTAASVDEYPVYAGEENAVTIKGVSGGLKYLNLTFSSLKLSPYSRLVVRAYQSGTNIPLTNNAGEMIQEYISSDVVVSENFQNIYDLKGEIFEGTRDTHEFDLKIFAESAGLLDNNSNVGFVLSGAKGSYENQEIVQYQFHRLDSDILDDASQVVEWSQGDNEDIYSVERPLEDAEEYLGDIYNRNYTYKYSKPVFPNTGNAIIKVYRGNEVIARYLYPTTSDQAETILQKPNAGERYFFRADEQKISRLNIRTEGAEEDGRLYYDQHVDEDDRLVINSSRSGYVPVSAKVSFRGVSYTVQSYVQWSASEGVEDLPAQNFYTLAGQTVELKAVVKDRQGNPITDHSVVFAGRFTQPEITFPDAAAVTFGEDGNGLDTASVPLDSQGTAVLKFRSEEATDIRELRYSVPQGYYVTFTIGGQLVEESRAQIRWIKPGIYYREDVTDDGVVYNTSLLTRAEITEATLRDLVMSGDWIIGSKVVGSFAAGGIQDGSEVVGISNVKINAAGESLTVVSHDLKKDSEDDENSYTYSTKIKAGSAGGEGEGTVTLSLGGFVGNGGTICIRSEEVTYNGTREERREIYTNYQNAGTGDINISNKLVIPVRWGADQMRNIDLINPNPNFDVENFMNGEAVIPHIYARVRDGLGNLIPNYDLTYRITGNDGYDSGGKLGTTNDIGILEIEIPIPQYRSTYNIVVSDANVQLHETVAFFRNNSAFQIRDIERRADGNSCKLSVFFSTTIESEFFDRVGRELALDLFRVTNEVTPDELEAQTVVTEVVVKSVEVDPNNNSRINILTETPIYRTDSAAGVTNLEIRQSVLDRDTGAQFYFLDSTGLLYGSGRYEAKPVTGVGLVPSGAIEMKVDDVRRITAEVQPLDALDTSVVWSVIGDPADPNAAQDPVLSVDEDGYVTAQRAGLATVRATTKAKDANDVQLTADLAVTVVEKDAYQAGDGSSFTYQTLDDGTIRITGYVPAEDAPVQTSITVPSQIGRKKVTVIGASAFEGSDLQKIYLSEGLLQIEEKAFAGSEALQFVGLPDTLTSIGESAFEGCTVLRSIDLPDKLTSLGASAFKGCTLLSSVVGKNTVELPEGLVHIEAHTFENCVALTRISLPEGFEKVGEAAFKGTGIRELEFGDKLASIAKEAFADCANLETVSFVYSERAELSLGDFAFRNCIAIRNISIPNNMKSIGINPFAGCSALGKIEVAATNEVFVSDETAKSLLIRKEDQVLIAGCQGAIKTEKVPVPSEDEDEEPVEQTVYGLIIPTGTTKIAPYAFAGMMAVVDKVVIPSSVTELGDYAFSNCAGIKAITIPEGVEKIGEYAFENCKALEGIAVPATAIDIKSSSLTGCSGLESITVAAGNPNYSDGNGGNCIIDRSEGLLFAGCNNTVIPAGVTRIGTGAFRGRGTLPSIVLPEGVKEIEEYAFAECEGLMGIKLPSTLTKIADYAFADSRKLTKIVLPDSLVTVGEHVFENCADLVSITLPENLEVLSDTIFGGCTGLKKVTFHEGLKKIGPNAFRASAVEEVILPEGVTTIEEYAFADCEKLKKITLPDTLTEIGKYSFEKCRSLTSIVLPSDVTTIGEGAFCASGLTTVRIPEKVSTIEKEVFKDTDSLTKVVLSEGLKEIGESAFEGSAVTVVGLPRGLREIGKKAFYDCMSLYGESVPGTNVLTIPGSVTTIGESAFAQCTGLCAVSLSRKLNSMGIAAFENSGVTSITLPATLADIPERAFSGSNLFTLGLSEGLTSIGKSAFQRCIYLQSAVLPDSLKEVGAYAFSETKSLQSAVIPGTVTEIGESVFEKSGIASAELKDGVSVITDGMFRSCETLSTVKLPDSLRKVGAYALSGIAVRNLRLPKGITEIGEGAFASNKTMKSNTLPEQLTAIGESAFAECISLNSIRIPDNVTTIPKTAFELCSSLTSITLTNKITQIEEKAFGRCNALDDVYYIGSEAQWSSTRIGAFNDFLTLARIHYAVNQNPEQYEYEELTDGTIAITKYKGSGAEIVLPAAIDGKRVTGIAEKAFENSSIKEIVIPEGTTWIGASAFAGAASLSSVLLPAGLTEIGASAFAGCVKLDKINFKDVEVIGEAAFSGCTGLEKFELGEQTSEIRKEAFKDCTKLSRIVFNEKLTSIGEGAFSGCTGLKWIKLYDGITSIGERAFSGTNITSVTIPSTVVYIGGGAFPTDKLDTVIFAQGMTAVPNGAFESYTELKSISMPDSLQKIGTSAFSGCTKITEIKLPNSLSVIGEKAFSGCGKLESIRMSSKVMEIGMSAFTGCSQLKTVYYNGTYEQWNTLAGTGSSAVGSGNEPLLEAVVWCYNVTDDMDIQLNGMISTAAGGALVIPETLLGRQVTSLGEAVFAGCPNVQSITIPAFITNVEEGALLSCNADEVTVDSRNTVYESPDHCNAIIEKQTGCLVSGYSKTKSIPSGVKQIGNRAFYGCSLSGITIPNTVTSIGSQAFEGATGISAVVVPESVKKIGERAFAHSDLAGITLRPDMELGADVFYGCSAFEEIALAGEWNTIEESLFEGWTGLKKITLPDSVKEIGERAFYGCTALEQVILPDSVESIGNNAFYQCQNLKTVRRSADSATEEVVKLPNRLKSIGTYAFYNCTSMKFIVLPSDLVKVGESAFCNSGIKAVTIPSSVSVIEQETFLGCPYLEKVVISAGVTQIKEKAFEDCAVLSEVTLGEGLEKIGSYAFSGCQALAQLQLPSTLTEIGTSIFRESGIKKIVIPENITVIPDYAFYDCSMLEEVTMSEGMEKLGRYAFYYCTALKTIKIPATLQEAGYNVFGSNLKMIYYPGTKNQWSEISFATTYSSWQVFYYSITGSGIEINGIDNASMTLTFQSAIDGQPVTSIAAGAFDGNSTIKEVVIPASIRRIGSRAFADCERLYQLTLSENTQVISSDAFQDDASLQLVHYLGTDTSWSQMADTLGLGTIQAYYYSSSGDTMEFLGVKDMDSLTSLSIPETVLEKAVTSIADGACASCNALEYINLSSSMKRIGKRAFYGCDNSYFSSIRFENGLESIGEEAFAGCSYLCSFSLPSTLKEIGDRAFKESGAKYNYSGYSVNLSGLTELESIGDEAFAGCIKLYGITLPEGLSGMGEGMFSDCTRLYDVTLPASLTKLEAKTFYNCTNLSAIGLTEAITSIGEDAFAGCTRLYRITWPTALKTIKARAFKDCNSGSFESITFPEGVTDIGEEAFSGCTNLNSITWPAALITIGARAFQGSGISNYYSYSLDLSELLQLESIGEGAFSECTKIDQLTLPSGLTLIGADAMKDMTSLHAINYMGTEAQWNSLMESSGGTSAIGIGSGVTVTYQSEE